MRGARARCCCWSPATFDAEPLYVPGVALHAARRRRAAWVASARAAPACSAHAQRRAGGRGRAAGVDASRSAAGGCRCRRAAIDEPLLPAPARAGRAAAGGTRACASSARFARRGPQHAAAAARRAARPARARRARGHRRRARHEVLVLPRIEPVRHCRAASGDGDRPARARAAPVVAAEVELDGLRPYRAGHAGLAHPLAGAGARRRAASSAGCAPTATPARWWCSTRAAPARRGATSTPRCAPPPRCASTSPRAAAARCCCPATGARPSIEPDLRRPGRTCTCAWRWSTGRSRPGAGRARPPPRAARSTSPPARRTAPPRGAGRTPRRRALLVVPAATLPSRRAVLEVAGCRGYAAGRHGRGLRPRYERSGSAPRGGAPPDGRRRPHPRARRGARRRRRRARARRASRLVAFAALGARSARCTGATLIGPRRRRRMLGLCAGRRRSPAARVLLARSARLAARRARAVVGALAVVAARPGRCWPPACRRACSARRTGTSSRPASSQRHQLDCRASACPTAASTSGCASAILLGGTRCSRSPRCWRFWPRAARRSAHPVAALVALGRALRRPGRRARARRARICDGALFALLLVGLPVARALRCRRRRRRRCARAGHRGRRRRSSRRALDGDQPWFDYEALRRDARPTKADAFSWTHSYGPLHWPRDGRELLRVKATRPAYWKAENLDDFDGVRWARRGARRARARRRAAPRAASWTQTIQVVDRGLRTDAVHRRRRRAGHPTGAPAPALAASADGTFGAARRAAAPRRQLQAARLLRRTRADASSRAPAPTTRLRRRTYLELALPLDRRSPVTRPAPRAAGATRRSRFPPYGTDADAASVAERPRAAGRAATRSMHGSPVRAGLRARAAARARRATTPYDFVQARAATASARRPRTTRRRRRRRYPLDGFLFDDQSGYCQQFSGAMALLLRMGGIPARVATGFTPGALRQQRKEYVGARHRRALVGRGLLPAARLGHVRPDARRVAGPRAARRPRPERRRRPDAAARLAGAWASRRPARSRAGDPGADLGAARDGGGGWQLLVGVALLAAAGAGRGVALVRAGARRRRRARRWPSSSARCTAPGATPAPA